ncbi:MAG: hypothetical protein K2V38_04765, partial [Gemmataceae bacterium]|nr:hypothetical protein [Gemmataceae bacterium]
MWPIFRPFWHVLRANRAEEAPTFADRRAGSFPFAFLGLSADVTRDLLRTVELAPHFTYRRYRKPKPNGGWRDIAEPNPRLKSLQNRIRRYSLGAEPHPAALAYRKGLSALDHAVAHAGASVVVTADVKDFFPTTAAARVETWWTAQVENPDEARILTVLTTDRGGLPQGASTSPAISNLVNFDLDAKLAARATAAGATYTRYCDDL